MAQQSPSTLFKQDRKPVPLNGLTKKLQRDGLTEQYDNTIRDQVGAGIVEKAPNTPVNKEFYIPHKCVVKEKSETTN